MRKMKTNSLDKEIKSEKPRYMQVREAIMSVLIERGFGFQVPVRSIITFIQSDFNITEKRATKYVSSFINTHCEPPVNRKFKFTIPYVRGTDWGLKQGYISWKGEE